MSHDADKNRLLLEIETTIREVNRQVINPEIPELTLQALKPAIEMTARARLAYFKEFLKVAEEVQGGELPTLDQIKKLRILHQTYDELVSGMRGVQVAIERQYLDVLRR
jgi:hypothetical protein